MQIFESNDKNTISTTTLNYGEPLGFWLSIFLKIDRLGGAKPRSPLNADFFAQHDTNTLP